MSKGKKGKSSTLSEQYIRLFFLTLLAGIEMIISIGERFQSTIFKIVHFFISLSTLITQSIKHIFKNSISWKTKLSKNISSFFSHLISDVQKFVRDQTKNIVTKGILKQSHSISKKATKKKKKSKTKPFTFSEIKKYIAIGYRSIIWVSSTSIVIFHVLKHFFTVSGKRLWKATKAFYVSFAISFKYFIAGFLFCLCTIFLVESYFFIKSLPSPKNIGKVNYPLSTHIFDRNGKLLYEIYRDENRTPVKLTLLPPYIGQAVIAIEDKDYRSHRGISLVSGVLRALKDTVRTNSLQGGSTITQQLVKSALLSPERTFERKAKEIILALWTEQLYTKDQILEMYLNQVSFGGASYGIEEAAKAYFGKSAQQLTIPEAALLAGLPQAPSLYSPFFNPEAALKRRNDVLTRMYQQRFITKEQKDAALKTPVTVLPPKTNIRAPHFVFYAKQALEEDYGIKQVEEGGLRVRTTLDLDIQKESEKILREELDKIKNLNVTNGGIIVTDPRTGDILAMVGSVDYFARPDGAFNVTTALRQPGSSIKPLLYSLALERGYTAATIINDSPIIFSNPGGEPYSPVNYDGKFHGNVTFRAALANSYNIPAVKILNTLGVQNFVDHARTMGIDTWIDSSRFGLSLSLGGGEVTMLDMAEAFGVFATGGYRIPTRAILKLENNNRDIVSESEPEKEKVMDTGITYVMSDIMSDNAARIPAFGPGSALEVQGYKVAVKTGTTDNKKDNWTDGYTPEFVVIVWVGNNDNTPMNPALTSGITGAAPIWHRVMQYLLTEKSKMGHNITFVKPDDVNEKVCNGRKEIFVKGTENTVFCQPTIIKPASKNIISSEQNGDKNQ